MSPVHFPASRPLMDDAGLSFPSFSSLFSSSFFPSVSHFLPLFSPSPCAVHSTSFLPFPLFPFVLRVFLFFHHSFTFFSPFYIRSFLFPLISIISFPLIIFFSSLILCLFLFSVQIYPFQFSISHFPFSSNFLAPSISFSFCNFSSLLLTSFSSSLSYLYLLFRIFHSFFFAFFPLLSDSPPIYSF